MVNIKEYDDKTVSNSVGIQSGNRYYFQDVKGKFYAWTLETDQFEELT